MDFIWNLFPQIQTSSAKTASSANRFTKKNKVYNLIKAEVEEKAKRRPSKAVSKVEIDSRYIDCGLNDLVGSSQTCLGFQPVLSV